MPYRPCLAVLAACALASPASAAVTARACAKTDPAAAAALAAVDACLGAKAETLALKGETAADLARAASDQCAAERAALQSSLAPCRTDPTKDAALVWSMARKAAQRVLDTSANPHGHGVDAIRDPNEDRR